MKRQIAFWADQDVWDKLATFDNKSKALNRIIREYKAPEKLSNRVEHLEARLDKVEQQVEKLVPRSVI